MGCLYQVSFPNGKLYLGITTKSAELRFREHLAEAVRLRRTKSRGGSLLHHALNKYPGKAVVKTLVVADDWDYLCDLERKAIKTLQTQKPLGYNLTEGGEGTPGYRMPEESRERQRQKLLGSKWTDEARARFSEKCKGRTITEEARAKMAKAKVGNLPSNAMPIVLDGVTYPSLRSAMRETGLGWDSLKKRMRHANVQ